MDTRLCPCFGHYEYCCSERGGIDLFKLLLYFSSAQYPEVELLDHTIVVLLIFEEPPHRSPLRPHQLALPPADSARGSPFLRVLASLGGAGARIPAMPVSAQWPEFTARVSRALRAPSGVSTRPSPIFRLWLASLFSWQRPWLVPPSGPALVLSHVGGFS